MINRINHSPAFKGMLVIPTRSKNSLAGSAWKDGYTSVPELNKANYSDCEPSHHSFSFFVFSPEQADLEEEAVKKIESFGEPYIRFSDSELQDSTGESKSWPRGFYGPKAQKAYEARFGKCGTLEEDKKY